MNKQRIDKWVAFLQQREQFKQQRLLLPDLFYDELTDEEKGEVIALFKRRKAERQREEKANKTRI